MSRSPSASDAPPSPGGLGRLIESVTRWALSLTAVRAGLLYSERRGPMLADSVTYRALFSVFAGLLLGFSIVGLWLAGDPAAWKSVVNAVQSVVPGLIGRDGVVQVSDLRVPVTLSIAGVLSLLALVGAALGAIGSLRTAVRVICGTTHDDVLWVWVVLRNLLLAVGIGAAFLFSAALTVIGRIGVDALTSFLGIHSDSPVATWAVRLVSLLVVYALDVALIAGVFRLLSGLRPAARSLWTSALLGGLGLLVLQELSGLFVGGATSNPLLASFASLLALLIWLNLSSQVILVSCALVVTLEDERRDRVHARFSATTFPERRVRRAEEEVAIATAELRAAQRAAKEARAGH